MSATASKIPSTSPFEMPPTTRNVQGKERKVGFELELAGLELEDTAAVVREIFGGRMVRKTPFELEVVGTVYGDFAIVVDATLLREREYLQYLESVKDTIEVDKIEQPLEKLLGWLAELVVPFEVATPPIPLSELACVEKLCRALAECGAKGTGSSVRYAFSLHINAEAPSLSADSIRRHLQAFLVLYEELAEASNVDLTRRLTRFIAPFSASYLHGVLDPDYAPSLDGLLADYLADNPTRNRPLDLLPLFGHLLGREALIGLPEDQPLQTRPTFHYRLPNCRIDEPSWSIAEEWNRWVEIERLAARPEELRRRCAEARPEPSLWSKIEEGAARIWGGEEV